MAHDLSRARAILIGNGSFRHPQISAVPAEDCVAAVSELLTGPLCGWPAERITVLDDLATPDQRIQLVPPLIEGYLRPAFPEHAARNRRR